MTHQPSTPSAPHAPPRPLYVVTDGRPVHERAPERGVVDTGR